MGEEERGPLNQILGLTSVGMSMVLAIFVGLAFGVMLDKWLDTHPWFTIIFLFFGIVAAFRNLYILVKRYGLTK